MRRCCARVDLLVAEGELARALSSLDPQAIAPRTMETVEQMRDLHPAEPIQPIILADFAPAAGDDTPPLELDRSVFDETHRQLPRLSGHGPDTWRFEHLQGLQQWSPQGFDDYFTWCADLARGTYLPGGADRPAELTQLLSAARLIGFAKPSGGVRPLAVGSCLRRATASAVARQLKRRVAALLSPVQFGVGVDGAGDILPTAVRLLLAMHPEWVCITTDARNAFNSVSRRAVLDALRRYLPELLPYISVFYADDGDLIIRMPWGVEYARSQTGVQQGDPLGPMLFALALQATLLRVQATAVGPSEHARVMAFLDDAYLIGPLDWATAAYAQLEGEYPDIGMSLRADKGGISSPSPLPAAQLVAVEGDDGSWFFRHYPTGVRLLGQSPLEARLLPAFQEPAHAAAHGGTRRWLRRDTATGRLYRDEGLVVLGVPIDHIDFTQRKLRHTFDHAAGLLNRISLLLRNPQVMLLLSRMCVLPMVTHLLRTSLPREVADCCGPFDDAARGAIADMVGIPPLDPISERIVALPMRAGYGGFGWRRSTTTRPFAFVASVFSSLNALCDVDVQWQREVEGFMDTLAAGVPRGAEPTLAGSLASCHEEVLAILPDAQRVAAGYQDELEANLDAAPQLQRRLTRGYDTTQRDGLDADLLRLVHDPGSTVQGRADARWRYEAWMAARSRGATAYLLVLPDVRVSADEVEEAGGGGYFALSPMEFRISVCMHLGIALPGVPDQLECPCHRLYQGQREPPPVHMLDPRMSGLASCCGRFGWPGTSHTHRHNQWARDWLDFLDAMGVVGVAEPDGLDDDCRRPDMLVYEAGEPALRLLDVAIVCPVSEGRRADRYPGGVGGAVARRERDKIAVYRRSAGWAAVQPTPVTVPLVGSTLGRVGAAAWAFFGRTFRHARADRAALNRQHLDQHKLKEYWRRRIAVGLRRWVARTVHRRLQAAMLGGRGYSRPPHMRGSAVAADARLPAVGVCRCPPERPCPCDRSSGRGDDMPDEPAWLQAAGRCRSGCGGDCGCLHDDAVGYAGSDGAHGRRGREEEAGGGGFAVGTGFVGA